MVATCLLLVERLTCCKKDYALCHKYNAAIGCMTVVIIIVNILACAFGGPDNDCSPGVWGGVTRSSGPEHKEGKQRVNDDLISFFETKAIDVYCEEKKSATSTTHKWFNKFSKSELQFSDFHNNLLMVCMGFNFINNILDGSACLLHSFQHRDHWCTCCPFALSTSPHHQHMPSLKTFREEKFCNLF